MSAEPVAEEAHASSLTASIKDGVAYSLMMGVGERTVAPCWTFLGGSESTFGLLVTFSWLSAGLFQVIGANVVDHHGRRLPFMLRGALVQASSWLLLLLGLWCDRPWNLVLLLLSQVIYLGSVHFTLPPWSSLMGDLVPDHRRGRYFGLRNFLCNAMQFVSFTLAAILLHASEGAELEREAFFVLFVVALLSRLLSTYYLSRMQEPTYTITAADRFTLGAFTRRIHRSHFGRFVLFSAVLFFGFGLAGPFFQLHILNDLKFSYFEFMVACNLQLIGFFVTMPVCGRIGDRWGNKLLLNIGGIGQLVIPLLWLCSDARGWVYAVMTIDGAVNAAHQMSAGNYLFDAVPPVKRARCTAYYNLYAGGGIAAGALLASWLYQRFAGGLDGGGIALGRPFGVVMVVSFLVRLVAVAAILPTFGELRVRPASTPTPAMEELAP